MDAISSAAVLPLKLDDWGIDVAVTASQKGLGLPPGLTFVALNNRAWRYAEQADLPGYYLNFIRARQALRLGRGAAFTPAIPLILAVDFVLTNIKQQGIENIWCQRRKIAENFRKKITNLGLPIFPDLPADSLTVFKINSPHKANEISSLLTEKFQIFVSRGQGQLANKVIRVGHLVNVGERELDRFLNAFQSILFDDSKKTELKVIDCNK